MLLFAITSAQIQYLLIGLLFVAAAVYVGRIFWRAFFSKTAAGCAKGCGGACGSLDVEALQRTIEARATTTRPGR